MPDYPNESGGKAPSDFESRIRDTERIRQILTEAGQRAIAAHYRAGRSIPVWRDDRVVWIGPQPTSRESTGA